MTDTAATPNDPSLQPLGAGGARPASGAAPAFVRALVVALFLISGAAGLIYEVVWTRMVTYRFGATLDAVTAIVVAFMGGLALGAWLLGKRADAARRPLFWFGVLEVAIAASAFALPFVIDALEPVYRGIVNATGDFYLTRRLLRFGLTILLLLVPTALMGATLPVLSKFLANQREHLGLHVGGLYAVNTIGAVLGTALSGFVLILHLGVFNTLLLAVAADALIGIASIALSKSIREGEGDFPAADDSVALSTNAAAAAERPPHAGLMLAAYAFSGFLALAYQVVWFRALVFNFDHLKNTTYSFSAMLTVFLIGISLGSVIMTPLADRIRRPHLAFGLLQIMIGLGGAFSFLVIFQRFVDPSFLFVDASGAIVGGFSWVVALLFAHTAVAIFWPTFAMGLLFPVAVRCALGSVRDIAGDTGRLYALNTVGAICGATLATFFIVPLLGVGWTMLLLAFCSLALGAFVILRTGEVEMTQRAMLSALPIVLLLVVIVRLGFTNLPIVIQTMQPLERMVYYADGPLATISVIANAKDERTIYVDNVGVAGTDPMLLTDQKSLAHVPMLFVKDPKRVLTVGFGSGGASYSYTRYPMLDEIHCVEIDPTVPRAASTLVASNWGIVAPKYRLPDGNEHVLVPEYVHERNGTTGADYTKDIPVIWDNLTAEVDFRPSLMEPTAAATAFSPTHWDQAAPFGSELLGYYTFDDRYELILDDARELLQSSDVMYDVIATDCTDLRYKTNANLYDLQYFTACSERLAPGGLVVVWMPLGGLTVEMFDVALRTFQKVFPNMAVWYMNNEPTHYCLLLGWNDQLEIDLDVMKERLAIPAVAKDLRELNLDSIEKILSCYITDSRFLADSLGDGMLNTENMPIIEFESPKFGYNDQPVIDNIFRLAEGRNDVMTYVVGSNDLVEETRERLADFEASEMAILRGHEKYRLLDLHAANEEYMAAKQAAPDDRAIDALLDFREVKLIADLSGLTWHTLQLGKLYAEQGRDSDALTYLRRVWEIDPTAGATDAAAIERGAEMRLDALRAGIAIYDRNGRRDNAHRLRSQMRRLGVEPPAEVVADDNSSTSDSDNAKEDTTPEAATP